MKKGQRIILLVDIETMFSKFSKGEELLITKISKFGNSKMITARNGFGDTVSLKESDFKIVSK